MYPNHTHTHTHEEGCPHNWRRRGRKRTEGKGKHCASELQRAAPATSTSKALSSQTLSRNATKGRCLAHATAKERGEERTRDDLTGQRSHMAVSAPSSVATFTPIYVHRLTRRRSISSHRCWRRVIDGWARLTDVPPRSHRTRVKVRSPRRRHCALLRVPPCCAVVASLLRLY